MLKVKKEGILLEKTNFGFENEGVFNPAVLKEGNDVHVFYRAVRKGNYSSIGYCKLDGPLKIKERHDKPLLYPQAEYESQGVEDPRIVKIEDVYYLTYTAHDQINALGALAVSKDLKNFEKKGLITPQVTYDEFKSLAECCSQPVNEKYFRYYEFYKIRGALDKKLYLWDKNVMFFPRRINGKLAFLHRVRPGIQIVFIKDLEELTKKFWEDYFLSLCKNIVMDPKYQHEASYIGGGCPPIETSEGWLLIYHGVEDAPGGYIYHACAALLDLDNPLKEISRLNVPLFSPDYTWELQGIVNNVVFPTGTALFGDDLYIYYGAADEHIAVASVKLPELLEALVKSKN